MPPLSPGHEPEVFPGWEAQINESSLKLLGRVFLIRLWKSFCSSFKIFEYFDKHALVGRTVRLKSVKTLPWFSLFISLPNPTIVYPRPEWNALDCVVSGRQIGHLEFLKVKGELILMIARSYLAAGISANGCILTSSTFLSCTNLFFDSGIGFSGSSDPAMMVNLVLS